jgi:hypothetical protein
MGEEDALDVLALDALEVPLVERGLRRLSVDDLDEPPGLVAQPNEGISPGAFVVNDEDSGSRVDVVGRGVHVMKTTSAPPK